MNGALVAAINERRVIRLNYDPGLRTIEPHAYGTSKDGNELLRAFQTEGASNSGEHTNWKLFRIDRADSIEVLDETFPGPQPGYNPDGDRAMARIFVKL